MQPYFGTKKKEKKLIKPKQKIKHWRQVMDESFW